MLKKINPFLISLLLVNLILLAQLKFTAWPEMFLWPYLMIKGWLPYKDIAIAHNPLLLANLALWYKLFGIGLTQLKVFTWLLVLAINLVTYWVARKLFGNKTALVSLLFLIPLQVYFDANGLWFDLCLSFFTPLIFYFICKKDFFWGGVFWSFAFLTKQTSFWLLIPITIYTLQNYTVEGKKIVSKLYARFSGLLKGFLIVFVPFLSVVWILKIFPYYIFWTFKFAGGNLPFSEGQINIPSLNQFLFGIYPFFVGLVLIFLSKQKNNIDLLFWAGVASLGIYPRWELFHFLPASPLLAILYASTLSSYLKRKKFIKKSGEYKYYRYIDVSVVIAVLIPLLFIVSKNVINNWNKESWFYEEEVKEVSSYVSEKTNSGDKIFVLNYWDHIYALTETIPATRPWIPQFSWYLSLDHAEENILVDLILESPRYVLHHPYSEFGLDSYRPQKISDFVERYYFQVQDFGNVKVLEKR